MAESYRMSIGGPPRSVSMLVRCQILFGGGITQAGWIFFGFGMMFVWVFIPHSDFTEYFIFTGELEKVRGKVTDVEDLNLKVNESPMFAYRYEFEFHGASYQGVSYSLQGTKQGAKVPIEFPKDTPSSSRIVGMSTSAMGLMGFFVLIFPIVGFCLFFFPTLRRFKAIRLLVHGRQTSGSLISKQQTNTQINNQYVYKLTFKYKVKYGEYEVIAKTHHPELLEDEEAEVVLYDEFDPSNATLIDHLPGNPKIAENGTITTGSMFSAIGVLLIPLATIIGHGFYALKLVLN